MILRTGSRPVAVAVAAAAAVVLGAGAALGSANPSDRTVARAAAAKRVKLTIKCRIAVPTNQASCRGTWKATGGFRDSGRTSLESTDRGEGSVLSGTLRGHRGTINLTSGALGYSTRKAGCPASASFNINRGTRSYAALAGSSQGSCTHVRVTGSSLSRTDVVRLRLSGVPKAPSLPPPVLGRSANAATVSGRVFIKKGRRFVPLKRRRQVPIGSTLDTRRGTVNITTASGSGKTQSGKFNGGQFKVKQSRTGPDKGLTEAEMNGSNSGACKAGHGSARASRRSHRVLRHLRTLAKGRFRTRGRYSAASVRGTDYTVADRCDGTLTKTKRGTVVVRDFRKKQDVNVPAGKSYLAKAR